MCEIWEEVLQEGIEKGMEKGRTEGRAEEKAEMVKNLLNVGTPIEYIQKASGWTEDQILAVK